jgi:hypothetical protein
LFHTLDKCATRKQRIEFGAQPLDHRFTGA